MAKIAIQKLAIDTAFEVLMTKADTMELSTFQEEFLQSYLLDFQQYMLESDKSDVMEIARKAVSDACDFILKISSLEWDDFQSGVIEEVMKGEVWIDDFKNAIKLN